LQKKIVINHISMNNKEQYVAAIDIGTTKIVAIVGKKNENNKIEILGLSKALSKGVKRGVVMNIEETVNAIETTVEDVQKDLVSCSQKYSWDSRTAHKKYEEPRIHYARFI